MKTKPILLVVVTLFIGFMLGMLTSAQIRYKKLKPVRVYFSEEKFRDGFYNTIQPDEKQKGTIDIILNKYAKINSELQINFRAKLDASMKDFRKEIDANVTKEQLARLKEMDNRRQKMIKHRRGHRKADTINHHSRKGSDNDGKHPPDITRY
jgi:hypothetical protein